jgi:hypothetical protein
MSKEEDDIDINSDYKEENNESEENNDFEKENQEINEEKETNQRIKIKAIELYPEDLESHSVNITLYGEEPLDDELVIAIQRDGLQNPLKIKIENREDGIHSIILDGQRRWRALYHLNKNKLGR